MNPPLLVHSQRRVSYIVKFGVEGLGAPGNMRRLIPRLAPCEYKTNFLPRCKVMLGDASSYIAQSGEEEMDSP